MAAQALIIDTDGGVDDAAALWWAVTNPRLDVVAVTVVWGNVPVEAATTSVARVLEAAGRTDIPIAVGSAGPIGPTPELRPAGFIHGDDGLGNTSGALGRPTLEPVAEPAAELLARMCGDRSGQISVVTLGPLSTVASAVRADATFASEVRDLVVMGGSARRGGNALPAAEANIGHDPAAAAVVVGAAWARPPLLVGLDVTWQATLTDEHFALLAQHRVAAAAFLDAPLRFYRSYGSTFTAPDCPCHDLLATIAFADPEVITEAPELPLAVDAHGGPAWGATVVDFRAAAFARSSGSAQARPAGFHPWRIALQADVAAFRAYATALFGG